MHRILLTPLRRIPTLRGDVMHALKSGEAGFVGFGEAYFTMVHYRAVKGWKRHRRMILNLIVPVGKVRIVVHNGKTSDSDGAFESFVLSPDSDLSYARLTVPPGLWMAFEGLSEGQNIVLNIASIRHDPEEAENLPLEAIKWPWPISME